MKLVYSFWSKPLEARWSNHMVGDEFEDIKQSTINCLTLSVLSAKKLGFRCELVTDCEAYSYLKHLPFDKISTELTMLNYNGLSWVEGKIMAMMIQNEPFIHIDWDVILRKKKVANILKNFKEDLIVQSVDKDVEFDRIYNLYENACYFLDMSKHTIPNFTRPVRRAYSCGIVGFNNLRIRDKFVKEFLKLKDITDTHIKYSQLDVSVIIEQYLLYVVANNENAKVKVLLNSIYSSEAKRIGYTHLVYLSKYESKWQKRIKEILHKDFPDFAPEAEKKQEQKIKISLCTVVMNRKEHLLKTLKHNLKVANKIGGIDINIIDYNSSDNLVEELKKNKWFTEAANKGVVHLYHNEKAKEYHRTLPKNTIHFLAKGQYVVNIDADNYVTEPYIEFCLNAIEHKKNFFIRPGFAGGDSYGRILCKKSDFEDLGGYDLSFENYGFEDANLVQRLKLLGLEQIQIPAHVCANNIKHSDALRIKNEKVKSVSVSDRDNRLKKLILRPNIGKNKYCEVIEIK